MDEIYADGDGGDGPDDEVLGLLAPPPSTLYHYTSTEGLLGILASGSIWATDLAFLNDSREMHYGLDLVRAAMLELEDGRWNEDLVDLILSLREVPPTMRLMVACFSENGDALGQWRGYGRQQGFALGVDTTLASKTLDAVSSREQAFGAVCYDADLSKALAAVWARMMMDAFAEHFLPHATAPAESDDEDRIEAAGQALYEFDTEHGRRAATACSYIKDPAFAEEREWRVVHPWFQAESDSQIAFRAGPLGPTPYVPLDLRGADGLVPISEVIVGPGDNAELRVTATQLLLAKHGYEHGRVSVRVSDVPFRP